MVSISACWERIGQWYRERGVELALAPPASPAAIAKLEAVVDRRLPPEFVESLQLHDGQARGAEVGWPEGPLASIDEIIPAYVHQSLEGPAVAEFFDVLVLGDRVRSSLFHPGRVPVSGLDGGTVFLDFIPGPRGVEGQVIKLISECEFVVLGASWRDALERWVALADAGALGWNAQYRYVQVDWETAFGA